MMILYGRIIPGEPLKISDDDIKNNQKEEILEQYNEQILDELKDNIKKGISFSC